MARGRARDKHGDPLYAVDDFVITKSVEESLRHKVSDFKTVAKTRSAVHVTLVTTYGVKEGEYSGAVQSVVTSGDLFCRPRKPKAMLVGKPTASMPGKGMPQVIRGMYVRGVLCVERRLKMGFMDLARERYSVRGFGGGPAADDALAEVLEAGRIAPTAANDQPRRVYVPRSVEAIEKANAVPRCVYGASTVLLVAYDAGEGRKGPDQDGARSGERNASVMACHMMLRAAELGANGGRFVRE